MQNPHIQQRFDERYGRHYYFNCLTKKSGWTIEEVLPPPAEPPPNPYPHVQQRFDARYGRHYYFNSLTKKSGGTIEEGLVPAEVAPPAAPIPANLALYGRGAHTRSLVGRRRVDSTSQSPFTNRDLDDSDTYDSGIERDRDTFFDNKMMGTDAAIAQAGRQVQLASSTAREETQTALADAMAKATSAQQTAEQLAQEARREAHAAADLWLKNAEAQKDVAEKVKRDELEFKLKLEQDQRETLRQRQKEVIAQAEAMEKHKRSIRQRVEMEAKIKREKEAANR